VTEEFAIPKTEFEERINRTQKLTREKGLDGLIAISSYAEREGHVCYLTNHHTSFPNSMTHIGLGYAAVVLPAYGKPILIAPMGYQREEVFGIEYAKTGFDYVSEIVAALKEKNLDDKKIGVAGLDVLPVEYYNRIKIFLPKATLEGADSILESQRVIKSPTEQKILREAARIADEGLKAGMEAVKEGVRECDVELAARKAATDAGADYIVRVRVASRTRIGELGWPMATRKKIKRGEFVYLDFIGWFKNYGFDVSRITVAGNPTEEQKELLEAAIEATDWIIETMKPGILRRYVTTSAREKIIIPIAHHIGIDIVENWAVTPGTKYVFEPGMVLCVEPSVVGPKLGTTLNFEEEVIITDSKAEVITHCPRVFW
jgi:Xaa-Pro aminopeptidase